MTDSGQPPGEKDQSHGRGRGRGFSSVDISDPFPEHAVGNTVHIEYSEGNGFLDKRHFADYSGGNGKEYFLKDAGGNGKHKLMEYPGGNGKILFPEYSGDDAPREFQDPAETPQHLDHSRGSGKCLDGGGVSDGNTKFQDLASGNGKHIQDHSGDKGKRKFPDHPSGNGSRSRYPDYPGGNGIHYPDSSGTNLPACSISKPTNPDIETTTSNVSALSAAAPIFIPRFFTPDQPEEGGVDVNKNVVKTLNIDEIMSYLTCKVDDIDSHLVHIGTFLSTRPFDNLHTPAVVEALFTKILKDAEYRYTGARVCAFLNNYISWENFWQCLEDRCREVFCQRTEFVTAYDGLVYITGFTLFIGELLLTVELERGRPHEILVEWLTDLVFTLLDTRSEDALICVVRALKLTGPSLEKYAQQSTLDTIFQRIKGEILDKTTSRRTCALLLNVIEQRAAKWSSIEQQTFNSCGDSDIPTGTVYYDGAAVFYSSQGSDSDFEVGYEGYGDWQGPDHRSTNDFGDDFDQFGLEEDEMDAEIADAYEQYLIEKETGQLKKSS